MEKEYSRLLFDKIQKQLPVALREGLRCTGWNVFGIYELVREEIEKDVLVAKKGPNQYEN